MPVSKSDAVSGKFCRSYRKGTEFKDVCAVIDAAIRQRFNMKRGADDAARVRVNVLCPCTFSGGFGLNTLNRLMEAYMAKGWHIVFYRPHHVTVNSSVRTGDIDYGNTTDWYVPAELW